LRAVRACVREHNTRLISNLRPTTRECVYLVTHDHYGSHDKEGDHTIRSAIAENPMLLHANFMALCFIEPKLLNIFIHQNGRNI